MYLQATFSVPYSEIPSEVLLIFSIDPSYENKIKAASKNCKLWDRFIAVGKFVDMSLADINVGLSEGVFKSVTGSELSQLILAAFDHSDKRAKLLHALASE